MAEILTITTPLLSRSGQVQPQRPVQDPSVPFDLQEVPTVPKPAGEQGQILPQNNGLQGPGADHVLNSLLKDPAAAAGYLKNLDLLQQVVKLLSAHNTALTQGFDQLLQALLVQPQEIAGEMIRQEGAATLFRGPLFDCLRQVLAQQPQAQVRLAVAGLLKAISLQASRQEMLGAVANNLAYLGQALAPSRSLSARLQALAGLFRQEGAAAQFAQLKSQAAALLEEMQGNLLFNSRLEKLASMTIYNLSRFQEGEDAMQEASSDLLMLLDGPLREDLSRALAHFSPPLRDGGGGEGEGSRVLQALTRLVEAQAGEGGLSAATAEKVEKIIYSLLSSPCHFTPLLHFVVPVQAQGMKSFAEIWLNPNGGEDRRDGAQGAQCLHLLLVFEMEGLGRFEAELYCLDQEISLQLLCPPPYAEAFAGLAGQFGSCAAGTPYHMKSVEVAALDKPRSLMQVFHSLPYKRTGVDVKV